MTENQAKLLQALKVQGAKLIGSGYTTPDRVQVPGVPKPLLYPEKQTIKACLKRGWIKGSNEEGFTITVSGIIQAD